MLEEMVLEKIRRKALLKYYGKPEEVRDFECQSHYFLYIWNDEKREEEWLYRETKGKVIDMWFEGAFEMKEHLTFDDLRNLQRGIIKSPKGENEQEEYSAPPIDKDHDYVC